MRKLPGYAAGWEMGLEVDEQARVLLQHAIAGTRNKAEAFLGEAAMKVGGREATEHRIRAPVVVTRRRQGFSRNVSTNSLSCLTC